jgi:transitional endoplasmic reticulum ATPase
MVLAATNRMDIVDPALLRSGRFDVQVEIPRPDQDARHAIFLVHTRGNPLAPDVDLAELATRTEGMVGADIESICRQAAVLAIREFLEHHPILAPAEDLQALLISKQHFESILANRQRRE